jgi:hypothetical protein
VKLVIAIVAVLAGKDDDLHVRRMGEQVADQREAFIGTVRQWWQAEVDQRRLRRLAQLPEQRQAMRAGMAGDHVKLRREGMAQGIADQRIVVDDEEQGLVRQGCGAAFRKLSRTIITMRCQGDSP